MFVVASIHLLSFVTSRCKIGSERPGKIVLASFAPFLYSLILPSLLPIAKPPPVVVVSTLKLYAVLYYLMFAILLLEGRRASRVRKALLVIPVKTLLWSDPAESLHSFVN